MEKLPLEAHTMCYLALLGLNSAAHSESFLFSVCVLGAPLVIHDLPANSFSPPAPRPAFSSITGIAVDSASYVLGAIETLDRSLGIHVTGKWLIPLGGVNIDIGVRLASLALLAVLVLIVWRGVGFVSMVAPYILIVVLVAVLSIFLGFPLGYLKKVPDPSLVGAVHPMTFQQFSDNWYPSYDPGFSFFVCLAIFFPALTDIMVCYPQSPTSSNLLFQLSHCAIFGSSVRDEQKCGSQRPFSINSQRHYSCSSCDWDRVHITHARVRIFLHSCILKVGDWETSCFSNRGPVVMVRRYWYLPLNERCRNAGLHFGPFPNGRSGWR